MLNLVVIQNRNAVTSSLVVSESFGKEHKHVLRDIDEIKGGVQNWTDLFYESTYIHPQNKQEYRMYYMNRDGFTLLAMGFTGKEALQFKLKYINAFNEMEQQLNQLSLPSYQIQDPIQRAYAWAEEQKEKQQLEIAMQEQKPKVEYYEKLVDTNLLTNIRDTAKELGVKEREFVAFLLNKGYLYRDKRDKLKPYSDYIGLYFELKDFNKGNYSSNQTFVTVKGKEELLKRFNKYKGLK